MPDSPIPQPKPADHEDVSWALSTAEANWRRGDHGDALKWLQRAAESASEEGHDLRYLELAKAASELASRVDAAPKPKATTGTHATHTATVVQPPPVVLPDGRKAASGPPGAPVPVAPRVGTARPPAASPSGSPPKATSAPPGAGASRPPPAATRTSQVPPRASQAPARPGASVAPPRASQAPARVDAKADREPRTEAKPTVVERPAEKRRSRASKPEISTRGSKPDIKKRELPAALTRPLDPDDHTQVTGSLGSIPPPPTDSEPLLDATDLEASGENEAVVRAPRKVAHPSVRPAPPVASDKTLLGGITGARPMQAFYVQLTRTDHGVVVSLPGAKLDAMSVDAMIVTLDPNVDLTTFLK